jgi:hypothetical protein
VYRCIHGNWIEDPCWRDSKSQRPAVVCLNAPWDHDVLRLSLKANPRPSEATVNALAHGPWGIELMTGERCIAAQGAHDSVSGKGGGSVIDYFCAGKLSLVRGIDRHRALWTIRAARYNGHHPPRAPYTMLGRVPIKTVWFGGNNPLAGRQGKGVLPRVDPPKRLPVIAQAVGPNDPHQFDLSLLVPERARLRQVWFIHGGRKPDEVLIEWIRSSRASIYGFDFPDSVRWGLTLWTQTPRRVDYQAPWSGVAVPLRKQLAPGSPYLRVALADVTGDRHPDVLVEQYPHTNHNCGPHEVVANLAGGETWRLFGASLCETALHGLNGLLALDLPYYEPKDSLCCWSKVERLRLRWSERRYVAVSDRIVRASR